MKGRRSARIRVVAAAVTVMLGLSLAAPCAASDARPVARPSARLSLRVLTDMKLATADTSKAVRFAQQGAPTGGSGEKSFLKSPKGVLAVALMAGGLAWAIVSRSQDAVHSPAR